MTVATLRDLIQEYVKVDGSPYLTADSTAETTFINRMVRRYTRLTLCLFSPGETFAVQSGVSTYQYEGATNPVTTAAAQEWARITHVMVNGYSLYDETGMPGEYDWATFVRENPTYITAASGRPTKWFELPSGRLFVHPTPDSAYTSSRVVGFYLHPTLDEEADVIEIRDDELPGLARYCAAELTLPYATDGTIARWSAIKNEYEDYMKRLGEESRSRIPGTFSRGGLGCGVIGLT